MTSPLTNLLAAARGAEKALAEHRAQVRECHGRKVAGVLTLDREAADWIRDIDAALTPLRKAIAEAEKYAARPFPQNPDSYEFDCVGCHTRLSMSELAQDTPRTGMRCTRCAIGNGGVAQSAEPRIPNPERVGSTPTTLASPVDCQCGLCHEEPPVASLGQGDYRRDVTAADIAPVRGQAIDLKA